MEDVKVLRFSTITEEGEAYIWFVLDTVSSRVPFVHHVFTQGQDFAVLTEKAKKALARQFSVPVDAVVWPDRKEIPSSVRFPDDEDDFVCVDREDVVAVTEAVAQLFKETLQAVQEAAKEKGWEGWLWKTAVILPDGTVKEDS